MKTKLRVRKDLRCRHSLKTSLFRRLGRVSSTSERSQRVVHARTPIELESFDRSEPVGQYVPHAGGVLWTEKVRTSYNRKSLRDEFKKKKKNAVAAVRTRQWMPLRASARQTLGTLRDCAAGGQHPAAPGRFRGVKCQGSLAATSSSNKHGGSRHLMRLLSTATPGAAQPFRTDRV